MDSFLLYKFGGHIHELGVAYFRNFTVLYPIVVHMHAFVQILSLHVTFFTMCSTLNIW